jgi:hypothetical protein
MDQRPNQSAPLKYAAMNVLARVVPHALLRPVLTWRQNRTARRFLARQGSGRGRDADVFTDIYSTNRWSSGESASGIGSEVRTTQALSAALPGLLRQYEIRSMLDIPCGDFNWMQHVDLASIDYTGGDIVQELVDADTQRFARQGRQFIRLDLASATLPSVDLVFCRDCFVHLPFALVHRALANIKSSGARYLLTTTYTGWPINYDTIIGGHRGLNLCKSPFRLPAPLQLLEDARPPGVGWKKCMGLWRADQL